ncbi:MAG: hypothetical protein GYB64_20190 [Chloroflexi bacterium]|nr:hypothetical protein [Chloroflexota bacterium]
MGSPSVTTDTADIPAAAVSRETAAWRIVLGAFAAFLLVCGGVAYGVQWYITQSKVDLVTEVVVGRGTVQVRPPNTGEALAVADARVLETGSQVITDSTAQATLVFIDPRTGTPVATMALVEDSDVRVEGASAPRFALNRDPYTIEVECDHGRTEILVMDHNRPPTRITVVTPHATIGMVEPGQYIIDSIDQETRLTTRVGLAHVYNGERSAAITLQTNQTIAVPGDDDSPHDAEYSLVLNNQFDRGFDEHWQSYNTHEPAGRVDGVEFAGRSAVAIDRSQGNFATALRDHGETGLAQTLNLDISDFSYLELRATFYIQEQSLSTCGEKGSECPLMLRLEYQDQQGGIREFITGFYGYHEPLYEWPLVCVTCQMQAAHQRVNLNAWYTYESGNLLSLLPEEQHPVVVREIRLYASGWAYKVFVSEIDLLAGE